MRQKRKETARVGTRIRALRKKHGLTQAQFAQAIGLQPLAVSRLERGTAKLPHASTLEKISSRFGVPIACLLGCTESSKVSELGGLQERRLAALQRVQQLASRTRTRSPDWFRLEALLDELEQRGRTLR